MAISRYLHECAIRAAGVLGDDIEASITMRQHGVTLRAGSSAPDAARCDQAEAWADDGPCVEAMITTAVRTVPSVASETRWLTWREQTLREGFGRALAVPAQVSPDITIALNLYSRAPGAWEEHLVRSAESYARLIASAVRLQLQFADLDDYAAAVYRGVSDAVVVERAVGAVMETNGCTEQEARKFLQSASGGRGHEEREIAEFILRSLVVGVEGVEGDIVDHPAPEH
jgi:hypothetical protein